MVKLDATPVKQEGIPTTAAPAVAAQNGMPSAVPVKQEDSKPEVKPGTPQAQGTPAPMDAGKHMYPTKVSWNATPAALEAAD